MEMEISDFIGKWQTLIAGFLALIGGVITTATLIHHHNFDKQRYREEREKTKLYKQSLLPDALSELLSYSKKCFVYLHKRQDSLPKKPEKAIATLKENIEYSDSITAKNLFEIVSFYQVHNERLSQIRLSQVITNSGRNEEAKMQMVYDATLLFHYFTALFDYARDEKVSVENIIPDEAKILLALKEMSDPTQHYYNQTMVAKIKALHKAHFSK